MPDNAGQRLDEARPKDRLAIVDRHAARVEAGKAKVVGHDVMGEVALRKTDREARRPIGRHLSAHDLDHCRRVDPAREKRAERHIADELSLDRTLDRSAKLADLSLPAVRREVVPEVPISLDPGLTVVRDVQEVAGFELLHAQESRLWIRDPAPIQITVDPTRIELRLDTSSEQRLDFGGYDERAVRTGGVVEGLDPQPVSGKDGLTAPPVVEAESKHAVDAAEQPIAPLVPAVHEHLGVRPRGEPVAGRLELTPEVEKIEDLAVEHNPDVFVLVGHGLEARVAEIDDRKPGKSEQRSASARRVVSRSRHPGLVAVEGDDACAVGPPVPHRLQHRPSFPGADRRPLPDDDGEPAHQGTGSSTGGEGMAFGPKARSYAASSESSECAQESAVSMRKRPSAPIDVLSFGSPRSSAIRRAKLRSSFGSAYSAALPAEARASTRSYATIGRDIAMYSTILFIVDTSLKAVFGSGARQTSDVARIRGTSSPTSIPVNSTIESSPSSCVRRCIAWRTSPSPTKTACQSSLISRKSASDRSA